MRGIMLSSYTCGPRRAKMVGVVLICLLTATVHSIHPCHVTSIIRNRYVIVTRDKRTKYARQRQRVLTPHNAHKKSTLLYMASFYVNYHTFRTLFRHLL